MLNKIVERPIAVTMTLVAVLVLGFMAAYLTPVSLMPNVDIPQITVQVSSALSARELESGAISTLRTQLQQVPDLKVITSETRDGLGLIRMEFNHGADIDYLYIEVNERVDRAMSSLPRELDRPKVLKASATDIPAFYINASLKNPETQDQKDHLFPVSARFMELSDFVKSVISKRIEQLPEVAMVDLSGTVSSEILILPDQQRLQALGIAENALSQALNASNIGLGNLTIRDGDFYYSVRFRSNVASKEEIEQIYLKIHDRVYQFTELARVVEHPRPREGLVISDGADAISMAVIKQSEAKMGDMRQSIAKLMELFDKDYPDISFTITRDQTALLDYSIDNLAQNLWVGAILACLIIFLFMRDLRTPFLITVAIPLSLVVSLLFFYLIGLSINIISLSGIALGIGMMVDNSIIVIDNITQWWERGHSLKESAVKASQEVIMPMLSGVLTTCAVFVPLIFLSGVAGALFYDQAMAVAISMFSSLAIAVLGLPVYYYLMFCKRGKREQSYLPRRLQIDYAHYYEKGLKWVFRHARLMFGGYIASIVLIFFLFGLLRKEKLPEMTQTDALLKIEWNERYLLSESEKNVRQLMARAGEDLSQYTAMVGVQQFLLSHTPQLSSTEVLIYVQTTTAKALDALKERLSSYLQTHFPKSLLSISSSGNIFDMIFSENRAPLEAQIYTTDGRIPEPDQLNLLLSDFAEAFPQLHIEPVAWQEHVLLTTNPLLMTTYGVSHSALQQRLRSALSQNQLFTLTAGGFSIPIVMGDDPTDLRSILADTHIRVDSTYIPLSRFVIETRARDFKDITAGTEGAYYPISLYLSGKDVKPAMTKIKDMVDRNSYFEVSFTGSYFSNQEMMGELLIVLVVALLLLFFILAAQFESLMQPLIIMSEIVVDIFGAFLILWICGASINLMSLIGLVVMCGIVINDSILKIDTINQLRQEGYPLLRAVLLGGQRRLKPIIMTSLTTILAVAPFLVRGDMGSDLQYPLSLALIGGMVVGTLVSIFFIPLLYHAIYRKKSAKA
jgi:Cation/multidrug efflux pump